MNSADKKFIKKAEMLSEGSVDSNRQVGAVIVNPSGIVVGDGCNDFPLGTSKSIHKDSKIWTVHAAISAITKAARTWMPTSGGCTMYLSHFPCPVCAGAIIGSGISRVVAPMPDSQNHLWDEHWRDAREMFMEAGVKLELYKVM